MSPRSSRSRRTVLALGAAACLLLGSGCSDDDGGGAPSTPTATVPSVPASPSATVSGTVPGTAQPSPSASPSGSPTAAGSMTVTIKDFAFDPATLTVAPGTSITVTNQDSAGHTLTAVGPGKEFDTGLLSQGRSATITAPTTPGSYPFHCDVHPNMTGTLVVA